MPPSVARRLDCLISASWEAARPDPAVGMKRAAAPAPAALRLRVPRHRRIRSPSHHHHSRSSWLRPISSFLCGSHWTSRHCCSACSASWKEEVMHVRDACVFTLRWDRGKARRRTPLLKLTSARRFGRHYCTWTGPWRHTEINQALRETS